MPNLELVKKKDVSSFRKIAIGTWSDATVCHWLPSAETAPLSVSPRRSTRTQ